MYETQEELEVFFKSLHDFRFQRELGTGAFGVAVLAFHETEQRPKVFKLPKDQKTTEALKVEGAHLVKLRDLLHPHIIQLHHFGKTLIEWNGRQEERYYLCLAFGGISLRSKLGDLTTQLDRDGNASYHASGTRLAIEDGLRFSIHVGQGLVAAHGFKDPTIRIIHRDIKPENILIDDESGVARIADFGISRVLDRSTGISSIAGTLLYMAPECFEGRAGIASDVYSAGIVMYEMFTGQLPFKDFPSRLMGPPLDPRTHNPEINDELASVILKALECDVSNRYVDSNEMLADLTRIAARLNPLPERYLKLESHDSTRYRCKDKHTDQMVMVHLIETQATIQETALEAERVSSIRNPRIFGTDRHERNEQMLLLFSPVPEGRSLVDIPGWAPYENPDRLEEFCVTMTELCDQLATAHAAGIVHGWLSPKLIVMGSGGQLQVHGFGVAPVLAPRRLGDPDRSAFLAAFKDSVPFMSPRALAGVERLTPQDDVFSVGAILFYFLTGRNHADKQTIENLIRGHAVMWARADPRELNQCVTGRLSALVIRALSCCESITEIAASLRECRWPEDAVQTLVDGALKKQEDGDVCASYELLDKALRLDPGNARVHYVRGVIYAREKEHKWAVQAFRDSANVVPGRDVYVALGGACAECGNHSEACEAFMEAAKYGDDAELHELLAKSLSKGGQCERACFEMERAIALEEDPAVRQRREKELDTWRERLGHITPSNELDGG